MGNQRARRQRFFAEHPYCCFCGGTAPATEIDHIPARYFFRNRQWPEGYEFPACHACNKGSSLDELVLGMLVRLRVNHATHGIDQLELEDCVKKLQARRPEWTQAMRGLSRNETRRLLSAQGLPKVTPDGKHLCAVAMPQEFADAANRYAEKLARALYFKVTGRAVPVGCAVSAKAFTNAEWQSPNFPLEHTSILDNQPALSRSGVDLSDQFHYRYAVVDSPHGAGFVVHFGEGIAMVMTVFEDGEAYQQRKADRAGVKPSPRE